jgi:hypothetical protein
MINALSMPYLRRSLTNKTIKNAPQVLCKSTIAYDQFATQSRAHADSAA